VNHAVPDQQDPEVFRSPAAVVIWWVWLLFAVGNLIDLAVQGRSRASLVAAVSLLVITGIVYVSAQRPRVVAVAAGLTIVNPLRDHRVGWAAVAGADPAELLRVRCEWPDGNAQQRRVIYAWAVLSSRRSELAAERRAQRRAQRAAGGFGLGFGFGGSAWSGRPAAADAPEPAPLHLDAARVAAALTERAEQARRDAPGALAAAPVSAWHWPAVAAVVVPALALLIAALA
jgi:Bacterial PH domain